MGDRSGLALAVGLTYQLVQWWYSHEAPFDDRIYAMFITVKAAVFFICIPMITNLGHCWDNDEMKRGRQPGFDMIQHYAIRPLQICYSSSA